MIYTINPGASQVLYLYFFIKNSFHVIRLFNINF